MRQIEHDDSGCRHTLVVHADGTRECDGERACACDALVHEWTVGCEELGCGCVVEHRHLAVALAA